MTSLPAKCYACKALRCAFSCEEGVEDSSRSRAGSLLLAARKLERALQPPKLLDFFHNGNVQSVAMVCYWYFCDCRTQRRSSQIFRKSCSKLKALTVSLVLSVLVRLEIHTRMTQTS